LQTDFVTLLIFTLIFYDFSSFMLKVSLLIKRKNTLKSIRCHVMWPTLYVCIHVVLNNVLCMHES